VRSKRIFGGSVSSNSADKCAESVRDANARENGRRISGNSEFNDYRVFIIGKFCVIDLI
jgi:hypothetical protein